MTTTTFARALVTGASSGIGREIARQLAAEGTALVLVARRGDVLQHLADSLDVDCEIVPADLLVDDQVQGVADRLTVPPEIDLLVNNAGFASQGLFHEEPLDGLLAQVQIHIRSVMALSHAAMTAMVARGHGGILNVSSVAGFQPMPQGATYAACKAFETSLTEALHVEALGTGVHVSALCPGFVDTPLLQDEGIAIPAPLLLDARGVARAGIRAVKQNNAVKVPGMTWKAAAAITDALPRDVVRALLRVRPPFGGVSPVG